MTILVIENNPISRKLARTALEAEGYSVLEAADGREGLALMAKKMPALVLQDLLLPDINGFDLVSKLRALPGGENTPILAMTGLIAKADEMRVGAAPFTDYLFKPVELSLLVGTVKSYLTPTQVHMEKRAHKILLVDDEPAQLKLFRTYLTHLGFDVTTATDGYDGLAKAKVLRPDAILSDVLMPGMDGFHFCMKVRNDPELAGIPVVLLSNYYEQEADKQLARRVGAHALVATAPGFREAIQALRQSLQVIPLPALDNPESLAAAHQERLTHQLDRHAKLSAQLARRCAAQSAQISVLATIGENFVDGKMDARSLLSEVLANYLNVMGFSCGAIYLAEDQDRLTLSAQIGFPDLAVKSLADFFGRESLLHDAMLNAEPLSISISRGGFEPICRMVAHLRPETLLISPLRFGNEALGVIVLLSDTPIADSDWITFSKAITNHMGQVIALSRAIAKLQYLASYDSLTDLLNRAQLRDRLQELLAAGNRSAVYLLNLDHFQEINNTLGYPNGNLLLQQVAKRLTSAFTDGTLVARLGADEFALLSPNPPSAETVYQGAQHILKSLAPPFRLDDLPIAVRARIGIALAREDGEDADTVLSHADMAQRAAKKTGNDYLVYPMHVQPYSPDYLVLLGELREAVDHDKLILHYQPKVSLRTGRMAGVESLLRWPHPHRGWVAPDQFIPLAEKAGLIHPLTLWVLDAALRQGRVWRNRGVDIGIAVNISARDLLDTSFPDFVDSICRATGTLHHNLTLELTERDLMTDPAKAETAFRRLNEMDIHFSIDDFGTGYSALAYLQKLSVDEIKIDKSFVAGLLTDLRSAAIVRSIIDLGRNLGVSVVAEGVEDQRVWEHLAELGCDIAQGYRVCRPLPPHELISWVGESSRSAKQNEFPHGHAQ